MHADSLIELYLGFKREPECHLLYFRKYQLFSPVMGDAIEDTRKELPSSPTIYS